MCSAVREKNPVLSGHHVSIGRLAVGVVVQGQVIVHTEKEAVIGSCPGCIKLIVFTDVVSCWVFIKSSTLATRGSIIMKSSWFDSPSPCRLVYFLHWTHEDHRHTSLKVPNVEFNFDVSVRHCLLSTHTSKLNSTLGTHLDAMIRTNHDYDFSIRFWPISALMSKILHQSRIGR